MEGEREYVFKHALTREVAYASIPRARRAHLHASFAEWVDRAAGRQDEYAPILAHHYAQAVRPEDADLAWADEEERLLELREKAIGWLRRASELALGRYEIDEGLALLDSALALEPARPIQSAIWHEIGRAHALRYDGEPFAEAMQTAIDLSDDPVEIADMYSDLARESLLRVGMWRQTPNPDRIETWIERAVELMPADGPTRAKVLIAQALWSGSTTDAEEASAIAEETGDPNLRFSALAVRASVAFRERDYEDSLLWFRRAFELSDTVSDPELVADPDLSAVWPALALGHFDDARQLGMQVHDMNIGLTPHHRVHAVAVPMEVEELLGDWAGVRRMRAEAEAAVEANLETPCVRNPRSILLCALAEEIAGNSTDSERPSRSGGRAPHGGTWPRARRPPCAARAAPRRPRRGTAPTGAGRSRRQAAHRVPPGPAVHSTRCARGASRARADRGGSARSPLAGDIPRTVRAAGTRDRARGRVASRAGRRALPSAGVDLARGRNGRVLSRG